MRKIGILAVVAIVATLEACGGGGGPTGPSGTDVTGTYAGSHAFSVTLNGSTVSFSCTGTFVVSQASGGTISGTLTLDPCSQLDITETSSLPFTGTYSNGTLTFTVAGQDQFIQAFASQGCTITQVDDAFAGTLANGRVQATFDAAATCESSDFNGDIQFTWTVDMTRP